VVLKSISVSSQELRVEEHLRIDSKYFFVKRLFDKFSKSNDYTVKSLKELNAEISSGSYIATYVPKEEGIKYFRVSDIKPYNIDENENNLEYVPEFVHTKMKVRENDIIIARTQATIEKLGVASIIDSELEGSAISQHVSKIKVNSGIISPYYMVAYLNSKFFKAQAALATHGDTRVELTHSQLKTMRVFLPTRDVLSRIETKVQTIIQLNRKSITLIEKAKQILRNSLKFPSDSEKDVKYFSASNREISEFGLWNVASFLPKYFEYEKYIKNKFTWKKLGDITNLKRGIEAGSNNYKTYLFKLPTDYAFIRTSDIINNEIDLYPDYFVSEKVVSDSHNMIKSGDIIFSKDGKIGEVAIATKYDRVMIASGFEMIRVKNNPDNITNEYVFTLLLNKETGFYPSIRRTVVASTIPHLREDRLKEIPVPIIDEQKINEITELVKKAFELKEKRKELVLQVSTEIDGFFEF